MESVCAFDAWLHETGNYTYHGDAPITGLTLSERDRLQLGWVVRQEQKEDAMHQGGAGGSYSGQAKRSHKQDIRQRLRKQ